MGVGCRVPGVGKVSLCPRMANAADLPEPLCIPDYRARQSLTHQFLAAFAWARDRHDELRNAFVLQAAEK